VIRAARARVAASKSPMVRPIQPSCGATASRATAPDGSRQASAVVSPSTAFIKREDVHGTVATVGMPSRS
jgi:hypothetical protein